MVKILSGERLAIVIVLTKKDGIGPVEISCRADYLVSAEGIEQWRPLEVQLTSTQKNVVLNFAAQVLANIKTLEGIQ